MKAECQKKINLQSFFATPGTLELQTPGTPAGNSRNSRELQELLELLELHLCHLWEAFHFWRPVGSMGEQWARAEGACPMAKRGRAGDAVPQNHCKSPESPHSDPSPDSRCQTNVFINGFLFVRICAQNNLI